MRLRSQSFFYVFLAGNLYRFHLLFDCGFSFFGSDEFVDVDADYSFAESDGCDVAVADEVADGVWVDS